MPINISSVDQMSPCAFQEISPHSESVAAPNEQTLLQDIAHNALASAPTALTQQAATAQATAAENVEANSLLSPDVQKENMALSSVLNACCAFSDALITEGLQSEACRSAQIHLENLCTTLAAEQGTEFSKALTSILQSATAQSTAIEITESAKKADATQAPKTTVETKGAEGAKKSEGAEATQATQAPHSADAAENAGAVSEMEVIDCQAGVLDTFKSLLGEEGTARRAGMHIAGDSVASLETQCQDVIDLIKNLDDSSSSELVSCLLQEHLKFLMVSQRSLENTESVRENLQNLAEYSLDDQAEIVNNAYTLLETADKEVGAQKNILSQNVFLSDELENSLADGVHWIAEDVTAVRKDVDIALGTCCCKIFADKGMPLALDVSQRMNLGGILQRADIPLQDFAEELIAIASSSIAGTSGQKGASEILHIALSGLVDEKLATSERMAYVDMLFQHVYPQHENMALLMKEGLVPPQMQKSVECAHDCMLSSRAMADVLLDGQKHLTQHGVVRNGIGSLSARSFLLTPDIVKSLAHKTKDVEALNYQLAHVALLQSRVVAEGLGGAYASSPEDAAKIESQMKDGVAWCKSLGLSEDAVKTAKKLATELADPHAAPNAWDTIREANDMFIQGLRGTSDAKQTNKLFHSVGKIGFKGDGAEVQSAFFHTNAKYSASLALDRHLQNISGMILETDRFQEESNGLAWDSDKIRDAIRGNIEGLREKYDKKPIELLLGGENVAETVENKIANMKVLKRFNLRSIRSTALMVKMGKYANESIQLRKKISAARQEHATLKEDYSRVTFSWLHKRKDRLRVSENVIKIADLERNIKSGKDNAGNAIEPDALAAMKTEQNTLLESLKGVDMYSMTHSSKLSGKEVSLDNVLTEMLPRAKAIEHHHGRVHRFEKHADLLDRRCHLHLAEKKQSLAKFSFMLKMGRKPVSLVRESVRTAVLQAFVASDLARADFVVTDHLDDIKKQLKDWGIEPTADITKALVNSVCAKLCGSDGTLKNSALVKEKNASLNSLFAKESLSDYKADLRAEGSSRYSAHKAGKKAVEAKPLERILEAGTHGLMGFAGKVGDSFVVDRKRGLVIDTGKTFHLMGMSAEKGNVAHALTLRLDAMNDRSFMVRNTGASGFEVLIKSSKIAALASSLTVPIPAGFFTTVSGGVKGDAGGAMTLQFGSQTDCEDFLKYVFETKKNKAEASTIWRRAKNVAFINEKGVVGNVGVTAGRIDSLAKFGVRSLNSSLTATVAAVGGLRHKTTQNASGQSTSFEKNYQITLAAGVGGSLKNTKKEEVSALGGKSVGISFGMKQIVNIEQGREGISGSMDFECRRGQNMESAQLSMLLSATHSKALRNDKAAMEKLENAFYNAPQNATVRLKMGLKESSKQLVERLRKH